MAGNEEKSVKNPASGDKRVNDVCGPFDSLGLRPNLGPDNGLYRVTVHIAYDNWNARMESFASWPNSLRPRPEELSAAGLFYTGGSDKTTCFVCGVTLAHWLPTDDPWIKHSRYSPRCEYIVVNKGTCFIEEALAIWAPFFQPKNVELQNKNENCLQPLEGKSGTVCGEEATERVTEHGYERSDDTILCRICKKDKLGILFIPCSHLVACVKCGSAVSNCPICHQRVETTLRATL